MDRLSALDSAFLRLETPAAHMHVGWLALLALPVGADRLDADALRRQIRSRLSLVPRFRQRLRRAPLGLGEPSWQDHADFRLEDHVRVVDVPMPLEAAELGQVADAFLSQQLQRTRPLWELLVVPRVAGRQAAIIGKVHLALVDGAAAVELGTLLFGVDPARSPAPAAEWQPRPAPSALRQLAATAGEEAIGRLRLARAAVAIGLQPRRAARVADSMCRATLNLAEDLVFAAPRSSINAPIGPRRVLRAVRLDMERVQRMQRASDATVNDIALALVSGALRRYAAGGAECPARLRAMIPISVRDDQAERVGNRIVCGMVELPVDEPAPLRRLGRVRGEMLELKASGRIAGSDLVMRSLDPLPGPVKDRAARLLASPRLYNLVVSNTIGPRTLLYAGGARVTEISPVIPLSEGHGLAVGVLSYGDGLQFAFHADPAVVGGVDVLPRHLVAAAAELERALGLRPPRHSAVSRGRAESGGGSLVRLRSAR